MNTMKLRLILSLALPTLLVVAGISVLHNAVLAFLLYAVGGCVVGPWLLVGARPLASAQGWSFVGRGGDRGWMHGAAWLISGVGLFGLYFLLKPWLLDSVAVASRLRALAMPERGLAVFLIGFVLTVPVAEEWWWRGQALPRCREVFGPRLGLVLSVLGFSGYHAVVLSALYDPLSVVIRMVAIIAGGFLFAAMALRTRGWRWAWSAHFAADLAIVMAFLLLVAPDL